MSMQYCACYLIFAQCDTSELREYRVFQQLLRTVPGLEARIMEGSDEETNHIAELVHALGLLNKLLIIRVPLDSERCFKRKVGRYEEHQGGDSRLDHSSRPATGSPIGS